MTVFLAHVPANLEIADIEDKLPQAEEELKLLLLPKDPHDEKNVILEIRAGTGGDEATLFAAEILRMYARYAERQGWKMDVMEASDTGVGGIKEAVALIEQLRTRAVLYVALDTLRYLEKGGRIGRMRALLGTLLSVKPIMEVRNAEIVPIEQVRTSRRVPSRLVELGQSRGEFADLAVLYTTTRDTAEQMADLCAAVGLIPRAQILSVQATGVLGVHTGPGALGLAGILKS